jgi:serine/threonine-protein kinase
MELPEGLNAVLSDRYTVERKIGSGGMADVYLTHDLRHNRKVAIKVMHRDLAEFVGVERFLLEIETTATLQHPHILPRFRASTLALSAERCSSSCPTSRVNPFEPG